MLGQFDPLYAQLPHLFNLVLYTMFGVIFLFVIFLCK